MVAVAPVGQHQRPSLEGVGPPTELVGHEPLLGAEDPGGIVGEGVHVGPGAHPACDGGHGAFEGGHPQHGVAARWEGTAVLVQRPESQTHGEAHPAIGGRAAAQAHGQRSTGGVAGVAQRLAQAEGGGRMGVAWRGPGDLEGPPIVEELGRLQE